MSCSGNCSSCGSDCQKQPLRHPNITGAILGQFMMEMAMRSQKNAAGEITGKNAQFEIDPQWYPVGVAGNLRIKLGTELAQAAGGKLPEDNATLIYSAMAVFMAEVYDTLAMVTKKGVEPLGEVPAPEMLALLKRWTEMLVGYELQWRDPAQKTEDTEKENTETE